MADVVVVVVVLRLTPLSIVVSVLHLQKCMDIGYPASREMLVLVYFRVYDLTSLRVPERVWSIQRVSYRVLYDDVDQQQK